MKAKMGRPKLAKGQVKTIVIGARFSPDEARRVHCAIEHTKSTKPEWVRKALLSAADSATR